MNAYTPNGTSPADTPPWHRRLWPVASVGVLGLLSLLLQPVPAGLLDKVPAMAGLPPLAQRAVLLGNPLILLLMAAAVGAALGHRVGLRSVLAGTAAPNHLTRTLGASAARGFALGLILAAADALLAQPFGAAWRPPALATTPTPDALVIGLFYGGLAEEVMMRWGVMSLVAWVCFSLSGRRFPVGAVAMAGVVAAGLFAAAHLPALAVQLELTPWLTARTMLINGAAGLLYGWLFWRHHLEAAMAAHAATHLGLAAWRVMLA